jgi:hypothetical protein
VSLNDIACRQAVIRWKPTVGECHWTGVKSTVQKALLFVANRKSPAKRTFLRNRSGMAVCLQQLFGSLSQHAPDLAAFAFDARNHHAVVAGGLVSHPGDDRGFSPLFDRNSPGSSDGSASDRGGMIGDNFCELTSDIGVAGVKCKERLDRCGEVFDVFRLNFLAAFGIRLFSFGETRCGSFGVKFRAYPLNGRRRRPNTARENLAPPLLSNDPVISSRLDSSSQRGIAGWKQNPSVGGGQCLAIDSANRIWCEAGSECFTSHVDRAAPQSPSLVSPIQTHSGCLETLDYFFIRSNEIRM